MISCVAPSLFTRRILALNEASIGGTLPLLEFT
jgi:hypothetical protein